MSWLGIAILSIGIAGALGSLIRVGNPDDPRDFYGSLRVLLFCLCLVGAGIGALHIWPIRESPSPRTTP